MAVVQFPPRSPRASSMIGVVAALDWYAANNLRPSTIPPVDAVGEETSDAYLAGVFSGLLAMAARGRVAHLQAKAEEQDRHRAALDREGHPGADAHRRVRDVLRRWADEISGATSMAAGGAA
jgi:hypothetical protein